MKKLRAVVYCQVIVDCPKCHERIDLFDLEEEDKIGFYLFGTDSIPGKWDHLNLEFKCPDCGEKFILNEFEY